MIGSGSIRGLLCGLILIPSIAGAALSDEIQVYTDDINAPGEFGLELHINTTPKGRRVPDYRGEVVPNHGLHIYSGILVRADEDLGSRSLCSDEPRSSG